MRLQQGVDGDFSMEDAVQTLVNFAEPVLPNPKWKESYARGLERFEREVLSRN